MGMQPPCNGVRKKLSVLIPRMTLHRFFATCLVLSTAAPCAVSAQPQTVALLEYHTALPAGWVSRAPSSSMRLAEFTTPKVAGKGAEVIAYFFGGGQGGSVEANLARWHAQFSNPNGQPVEQKLLAPKPSVFKITIAEYRGTYARGIGAGSAPDAALLNHVLIAAIVETPKGTLTFQLFGPSAAVDAQRDAYIAFVSALK